MVGKEHVIRDCGGPSEVLLGVERHFAYRSLVDLNEIISVDGDSVIILGSFNFDERIEGPRLLIRVDLEVVELKICDVFVLGDLVRVSDCEDNFINVMIDSESPGEFSVVEEIDVGDDILVDLEDNNL